MGAAGARTIGKVSYFYSTEAAAQAAAEAAQAGAAEAAAAQARYLFSQKLSQAALSYISCVTLKLSNMS